MKTVLLMLDWLSAMTHSDGEIAYFNNDSTKGIALPLNRLLDYASAIGLRLIRLDQIRRIGSLQQAVTLD